MKKIFVSMSIALLSITLVAIFAHYAGVKMSYAAALTGVCGVILGHVIQEWGMPAVKRYWRK